MSVAKRRIKQWTFGQMILWGFNFIVGYAFVIGLNDSYTPVGNLTILSLLIGGFIAFITGLSFGRLSQKFSGNGGIFLYTRKIFSRKTSYFAAFFQYIQAPIVGISAVLGMVWAFTGLKINGHQAQYTLIIFFVAIIAFGLSWMVVWFGFLSNKYSLYFLWFMKWMILGGSIILALIQLPHFGHNIAGAGNAYKPHITYDSLIGSVFTFFFAFGGFEGIVTVAGDVKDSKKNMIKIMIIIIILALLFYIFYFYITLGALGSSADPANKNQLGYKGGDFNPINVLLTKYGIKTTFGIGFVSSLLLVLITGSQIANKSTSRIQNGWVNAKELAKYSHGGFLPKTWGTKNKYSQYSKTLMLDNMITIFLVFIFYLIYRFTDYNIAGSLDLYTISAFIQYLFAITAVISLWKRGLLILRKWEIICYFGVFFLLIMLLVSYFYGGFETFFKGVTGKEKLNTQNIKIVVAVGTYTVIGFLAIILYKYGIKKEWYKHDIYKENYDHKELKKEMADMIKN